MLSFSNIDRESKDAKAAANLFADQPQNVTQSLYRQLIEGPECTVVIHLSSF